MTLSPSRSYKNLADSPLGRANGSGKVIPNSLVIRLLLPFCFVLLFGMSIYLYNRIGSQSSFEFASSSMELSSNTHYFARQWLQHQAKEHSDIPNLFHPGISTSEISNADPFSLSTGINVWDMYEPVISCPDILRVGKIGEGGKWVCGMSHLARQPECVMYSFGISTDMSFEVEIVLRTNCVIHAFDPTVGKLPYHNLKPEVLAALTTEQRARIHFHKTAMGEQSGSSELHSFNEQFLDIMHRLNHSFVDLLKVDIEGGEWSVFNGMFRRATATTHGMTAPLPVGQLLIELHYHSMDETETFFTGAARGGLLPYSREINLQPCIGGGNPVAVEYSFINPALYFSGQLTHTAVPAPHSPGWHTPISAVIYYLTQHARAAMLAETLTKLYAHFWQDYPTYPVVIFHDDLTAADERLIHAAVPRMRLRFVKITLATPESLIRSGKSIPDRTVCAPASSTLGYRHMCRFHATLVHKYLHDLGYVDLEYVMRMDDDGELTSPIGYDLFRFMKENNKKYGFVNMVADDPACVTDLWEQSEVYFNTSVLPQHPQNNQSLFQVWPKGVVFYNNLEISSVSLWKDPRWLAYMSFIDEIGGIYTLRWGDAPLHTIGVTMLLSKLEIHAFTDIGYKHEPFVDQQPKGLPMPRMDPFLGPNVECHYYDKWMCFSVAAGQNFSMNSTTNSSIGGLISQNASLTSLLSLYQLNTIHYTNALPPAPAGKTTQHPDRTLVPPLSGAVGQAALFTFAHGGREEMLAATLKSIFDNYLAYHPTKVIVFYNEKGTFTSTKVREALKTSNVLPLVSFKPVALPSTAGYQVDDACASSNIEVRESSLFLRSEAVQALKAGGFSWLFRFGDDARLRTEVKYNLFDHMHSRGKLFGFVDSITDRAECVDQAWAHGTGVCEELHRAHAGNASSSLSSPSSAAAHSRRAFRALRKGRKNTSPVTNAPGASVVTTIDSHLCSEDWADWPARKVILTNFEISHMSVWENPVCARMFDAVNAVEAANEAPILYGDSVLHSLCVAMTLPPERIAQLKDVEYRFNWGTAKHIQVHAADPRDSMSSYRAESVSKYDQAFAAQKIGWLGGDVAASVALPNEADVSLPPNKLLWLFGDSIVGVSSPERRVKDYSHMISNSIGVSVLDALPADTSSSHCTATSPSVPRGIDHLTYHWKTDKEGHPGPVLSVPPINNCRADQQRLWPIAGLSVVASTEAGKTAVKLFLLADIVCLNGDAAEKLQYEDYETALLLVHNPFDAPQSWKFDFKVFPDLGKANVKWISIVSASGKPFASSVDDVYLLGAYRGKRHGVGHQVLGRVPANALLQLDLQAVTVLQSPEVKATGASTPAVAAAVWHNIYASSPDAAPARALRPHALFEPLVSEASLHFDAARQEWQAVSLLFLDMRVQLCCTKDILGLSAPWNCSFVAVVDPKWTEQPNLITYAGKAHPQLLPPRAVCPVQSPFPPVDVVITYVSNSLDTTNLLYEPAFKEAYTPKFVHIFGG